MDLRCGFPDPAHEREYSLYTWVASTSPLVRTSRPLGHAQSLLGVERLSGRPNEIQSSFI